MRNRHNKLHTILPILLFFVALIGSVFLLSYLQQYKETLDLIHSIKIEEDKIREFHISEEVISYYVNQEKDMKQQMEELTLYMMQSHYEIDSLAQIKQHPLPERCIKKIKKLEEYDKLVQFYTCMLTKLKYFPVPNDLLGKQTISYDNSWGGRRTYGGERKHEGTDLMTSNNVRGYFPILSIGEGVVENVGWLKLGGYRIGIRGSNGCYYYYAHLDSYVSGIEVGDKVRAGQLLGFMGDTGYSEKEGTTGNFPVHLHLGMYVNFEGKEISVNPYYILKYLEQHRLSYSF
ncbi:MAG: M23 family metallopeptidase [bacterium]|nr:M23 family metallopeptidase [bacterium]